ncbi:hypothetical protein D3C72_1505160 [compost metagenome]
MVEEVEQALATEAGNLGPQNHLQGLGRFNVRRVVGGNPHGCGACRAKSQSVAYVQGIALAIQATQAIPRHRRAAAQGNGRLEASRRGEVGTDARQGAMEFQQLPGADQERLPGLHDLAIQRCCQVRAGNGQTGVLLHAQGQAAQSHFDHRRIQRVAQQGVGPGHRDPVERTALGHADMPTAEAPGILQLRQRRTAFNAQARHVSSSNGLSSPPNRMNSLRSMGTKRTRSPGRSKL